MNEKIEFVKDEKGYVRFYLEINALESHYADVSVFEVTSWNCDDEHSYNESELRLKATIKWDGCSHVNFEDSGYLHLCGKSYWVEHGKMMLALYETIASKITGYNKDVAE